MLDSTDKTKVDNLAPESHCLTLSRTLCCRSVDELPLLTSAACSPAPCAWSELALGLCGIAESLWAGKSETKLITTLAFFLRNYSLHTTHRDKATQGVDMRIKLRETLEGWHSQREGEEIERVRVRERYRKNQCWWNVQEHLVNFCLWIEPHRKWHRIPPLRRRQ